jgi:hypothetical protein
MGVMNYKAVASFKVLYQYSSDGIDMSSTPGTSEQYVSRLILKPKTEYEIRMKTLVQVAV